MIKKINEVIKNHIRPQLQQHYGDIELIDVEDGIVKIKLLGACSNCPSAQITVENVIEEALKNHIKKIEKVIVVNQVSEDLIDMAKKLIHHRN